MSLQSNTCIFTKYRLPVLLSLLRIFTLAPVSYATVSSQAVSSTLQASVSSIEAPTTIYTKLGKVIKDATLALTKCDSFVKAALNAREGSSVFLNDANNSKIMVDKEFEKAKKDAATAKDKADADKRTASPTPPAPALVGDAKKNADLAVIVSTEELNMIESYLATATEIKTTIDEVVKYATEADKDVDTTWIKANSVYVKIQEVLTTTEKVITEIKGGAHVVSKTYQVLRATREAAAKMDQAFKAAKYAATKVQTIVDDAKASYKKAEKAKESADLALTTANNKAASPSAKLTSDSSSSAELEAALIQAQIRTAETNVKIAESVKQSVEQQQFKAEQFQILVNVMFKKAEEANVEVELMVFTAQQAAVQATGGKSIVFITAESVANETHCKPVCADAQMFPVTLVNGTLSETDLDKFMAHLQNISYYTDEPVEVALACNDSEKAPCMKDNTTLYIVLGVCGAVILFALIIGGVMYSRSKHK